MQHRELLSKLFQLTASEEENPALLKKIAEEHPYFTLAHFLELKNITGEDASYKTIVGKLTAHFNNTYLLNIRLDEMANSTDSVDVISVEKETNIPEPSPIIEPLSNLPETENLQTEPEKELSYEPLHTTDYFASQGIKITDEPQQTSDKLGKQLKSFTEWLKTMKKVHGNILPESPEVDDEAVQKLAENSNIETEVTTEAMAEVYVRQGKYKKAIQIYEKLSLQNPSKKVYFADKIGLLKEK